MKFRADDVRFAKLIYSKAEFSLRAKKVVANSKSLQSAAKQQMFAC